MEDRLISLKAAIDALTDQRLVDNMDSVNDTMLHKTKRAAQRILASLPSAQPERKRGKWNRLSDDTFHCLECGKTFAVIQGKDYMSFCPSCGSDMREGEQDG